MKHYCIEFEYDTIGDVECPLDWEETLGVVTVSASIWHSLSDSVEWELDVQDIKEWADDANSLMIALEKHFKRNGYHYEYVEFSSYGEWWNGYIVNENSDFLPVEELRSWLDGEVYSATLYENLNPYRAGSRWNDWADLDTFWGICGHDPDYNPFGADLDAKPAPPKGGRMVGTVPNVNDDDIDNLVWRDFSAHHIGVPQEWVDWKKIMALYTVRFTEDTATVYAL